MAANKPTVAVELLPDADTSPAKLLVADLVQLRKTLRESARAYLSRLEADVDELAAWASQRMEDPAVSKTSVRDLRDMLALIRTMDLKPAKGRRKDLKKIESVLEDLRFFVKSVSR